MSEPPLRVVYLLEDTPLFGGVKVVLRQADLLADRGHRVTVVSPGPPPDWHRLRAGFLRTEGLGPGEIPAADVVVASYWTTIEPALASGAPVVHYCQGLEQILTHNRDLHAEIRRVYALPVPAIAVSPHLAEAVRDEYRRPARLVPQPLEPAFRPAHWGWTRRRPRRRPRILVAGPLEIDWKGVATALEAVALLRGRSHDCGLVRLSQWALTDEETALVAADEFHRHLPPAEVPALLRSCDLLLAPSWEQEGFGLPVLEAMACGVPVVASDIAAFRGFAAPAAELVPARDPERFAAAAAEVLGDPSRWRRMRRAGLAVARRFDERRAADATEAALRWVASGAWEAELRELRR